MSYRIAYVNHVSEMCGAEQSLAVLLSHLDRDVCEPLLIFPGPGALDDVAATLSIQSRWLAVARFRRTRRPARVAAYAMRWDLARRDLARVIREEGIDIVHCNSTTAQLFGGAAARAAGVPSVWHVRDLVRLGPAGRICRRLASHALAISEAVRCEVFRGCGRFPLTVVRNGIDADRFAAAAHAGRFRAALSLGGVPVVAVIGQLVPWKGHEAFLSAFSRIVRHVPDAAAVIAGEDVFGDHPGIRESLERRRDKLGLHDAVKFLGQRDDVADMLSDCDVLAVPSRAEPFGRVALEAMALGKPVVGFDAGGLPEVVVHKQTGVLAPRGNIAAFAEALVAVLSDPDWAQELGAAGHVRVRQCFSAEQMARRIESVYAALIQHGGRR